MLEFNNEHKKLNGSLKNRIGMRTIKTITVGTLIITITLFSGFRKTQKCDISDKHAHKYVYDEYFDAFHLGEEDYLGKWQRTEEYILIDDKDEKLIEFESSNGLFKIADNKEKINKQIRELEVYTIYEYNSTNTRQIEENGEITTIKEEIHGWTKDIRHPGLTGKYKTIEYSFYGYKIVENENGEFELVRSPMVSNFSDLPEEFIYVRNSFISNVYSQIPEKENDNEINPINPMLNFDIQDDLLFIEAKNTDVDDNIHTKRANL